MVVSAWRLTHSHGAVVGTSVAADMVTALLRLRPVRGEVVVGLQTCPSVQIGVSKCSIRVVVTESKL